MPEPPPMPSDDVLERAHGTQLRKMLAFIAVWCSLFVGLIAVFITLIGRKPGNSLEPRVQYLVQCLALVLAIGNGCLTIAILGKFQELVFLETQKAIGLASFYIYLLKRKILFPGAQIWDWIVRGAVLGLKTRELENLPNTPIKYPRTWMNVGLSIILIAVLIVLAFLWYSIRVLSMTP